MTGIAMRSAACKPPRIRARRGAGDLLRAEIVAATKDLLAASGSSEAVSIRAVAQAVGVTPPSIYLHFADKDELIAAVVVDVFAELDAAMTAAGAAATGPLDRLHAFGHAYVQFAVAHPEHYRVATMERSVADPARRGGSPQAMLDKIIIDSAFAHLLETVKDCMAAGIFAAGDPLPVTLQMWSAVHGVASLVVAKPHLPWGDVGSFTSEVLSAVAMGRATLDRLGGRADAGQVTSWLAGTSSPAEQDAASGVE
jgi:AcrR family transcriptional regulator